MAYQEVNKLAVDDYLIDLTAYVKKSDIINIAHPVGDVMIRNDNTNPGTLPGFEGTTWQLISQGRFPIGANSTFPLGSEGGSPNHRHATPALAFSGNSGSHTLTAAQSGLRGHNHTQDAHNHSAGTSDGKDLMFLKVKESQDIIVSSVKTKMGDQSSSGVYHVYGTKKGSDYGIGESQNTASKTATNNAVSAQAATQGHNHTINHTHPANYTDYQDTLPPYHAFNIWVRIS